MHLICSENFSIQLNPICTFTSSPQIIKVIWVQFTLFYSIFYGGLFALFPPKTKITTTIPEHLNPHVITDMERQTHRSCVSFQYSFHSLGFSSYLPLDFISVLVFFPLFLQFFLLFFWLYSCGYRSATITGFSPDLSSQLMGTVWAPSPATPENVFHSLPVWSPFGVIFIVVIIRVTHINVSITSTICGILNKKKVFVRGLVHFRVFWAKTHIRKRNNTGNTLFLLINNNIIFYKS